MEDFGYLVCIGRIATICDDFSALLSLSEHGQCEDRTKQANVLQAFLRQLGGLSERKCHRSLFGRPGS